MQQESDARCVKTNDQQLVTRQEPFCWTSGWERGSRCRAETRNNSKCNKEYTVWYKMRGVMEREEQIRVRGVGNAGAEDGRG